MTQEEGRGQERRSERGRLALVSAVYPALSETFVHREVTGLRERGWCVDPVCLHPLGRRPAAAGVGDASLILYGRHLPTTLLRAGRELVAHPLRAAGTLALALRDALLPRERTSFAGRVRQLGLAVMALGLAHWLRQRRTEQVHCQFANGPTTVGMYAARQLGVPFSFTGHANDLFDRRSLLVRKLERADLVACISHWHRDWYRQLAGIADGRCALVRCGVDIEHWSPTERPLPEGAPLHVVCVARLIPKKGIDTLIRAAADAAKRHELRTRLTVVGEGPERERLEALARELGCASELRLLGAIDNDEVRRLMSEADLFVLPCRTDRLGDRDGIPVVLMEAMAAGLPVIVGNLPTIRELVTHERSGLLVPPDDPASVADGLARLAREPNLRRQLATAARERIEEEFSLQSNLDRLDQRLAALLGR